MLHCCTIITSAITIAAFIFTLLPSPLIRTVNDATAAIIVIGHVIVTIYTIIMTSIIISITI